MTARTRFGTSRPGLILALAIALMAAVLPAGAVSAAPTSVAFDTQPGGPADGGSAFPTQPIVHVEDGSGPLAGQSVSLAIKSGTGAPGATLTCSGGLVRTTDSGGDAAYAGCAIDRKGTGYVLVATAGALTAQSAAFDVVPGPAHHLVPDLGVFLERLPCQQPVGREVDEDDPRRPTHRATAASP